MINTEERGDLRAPHLLTGTSRGIAFVPVCHPRRVIRRRRFLPLPKSDDKAAHLGLERPDPTRPASIVFKEIREHRTHHLHFVDEVPMLVELFFGESFPSQKL